MGQEIPNLIMLSPFSPVKDESGLVLEVVKQQLAGVLLESIPIVSLGKKGREGECLGLSLFNHDCYLGLSTETLSLPGYPRFINVPDLGRRRAVDQAKVGVLGADDFWLVKYVGLAHRELCFLPPEMSVLFRQGTYDPFQLGILIGLQEDQERGGPILSYQRPREKVLIKPVFQLEDRAIEEFWLASVQFALPVRIMD